MKKIKSFLTGILALLLTSCGGNSEETPTNVAPPSLISASIENGAKDIGAGSLEIIFTFDQNVKMTDNAQSRISINEAAINYAQASFKKATIALTGLQKGKSYELNIPKGVITGTTGAEVAALIWKFSTVPAEEDITATAKLCTPNPMPQTQKVFNYLNDIYGHRTLSCTMANVNWNTNEAELVYKATGKYPAMNCFDYIHLPYSPANWIDYSNTQVAEEWWKAGGLIAANWHWLVPLQDGSQEYTYSPTETTFRPKNIFVEGSWEKKVADADLGKMANLLLLLQDKGIPVIWRPLHEAAGNIYEPWHGEAWFWWGYDGAEVFKKLWIYMFEFFQSKGINNLIWVFTTQQNDADFYPGDKYVDIIGRDIYNMEAKKSCADQYNAILKSYPDKVITLSECGSVASIAQQWEAGARWAWFMPWYQNNATTLIGHEHADETWWKDAISQDFVVTRDQLPSFK